MKTGVLVNITNINEIEKGLNHLEIEMDDFSTYTLFGNIKEYMDYIDKEIEFNTRKDIVNGVVKEVISNIAISSIVQIADKSLFEDMEIDSGSLIPEKNKSVNVITFDKSLLKRNDVALAQIVLAVSYTKGKSRIAKWNDFTCLDINSQSFNLRLFTNSDEVEDFCKKVVGHYIMVDIKNDPKYGLQVFDFVQLYEEEVQIPPEVFIADVRLSAIAKRDKNLWSYIQKYDLLEYLKRIVYFEPGYHLVEMASEIIMIQAITKIYEGYDRDLLYKAVFASRGYLVSGGANLSNPLVNYHRLITSDLKNDTELIKLLDITGGVDEGDINKIAYLSIRRHVTSIMKERRGINEETDINNTLNIIDTEYSGLFKRGLV